MTTYTFTGAVAYDRLGSSWRTAAGMRSVSVTDPATGLVPANLKQAGLAVTWLTADANSRYSFTCDVPGVVVDFGAGSQALYANEVPGLAIAAGGATDGFALGLLGVRQAADMQLTAAESQAAFTDATSFLEDWSAPAGWSTVGGYTITTAAGKFYGVVGANPMYTRPTLRDAKGRARYRVKLVTSGARATESSTFIGWSNISVGDVNKMVGVGVHYHVGGVAGTNNIVTWNQGVETAVRPYTPGDAFNITFTQDETQASVVLASLDGLKTAVVTIAKSAYDPSQVGLYVTGGATDTEYLTAITGRGSSVTHPSEAVTPSAQYGLNFRASNHTFQALLPAGYDSRKPAPLVFMPSGFGGDVLDPTNADINGSFTTALLNAGYMVCSTQASLGQFYTDYVGAYTYLKAHYNVGPVLFLCASFGAVAGLLNVAKRSMPVAGLYALYPVTNLADVYAVNPALATGINGAYNIPAGGTYAVQTAGFDPNLYPGTAYRGVPMRFRASYGDTTVNKTTNADAFLTKIAPYGRAENVTTTGNHGDISNNQSADLLAFFESCLGRSTPAVRMIDNFARVDAATLGALESQEPWVVGSGAWSVSGRSAAATASGEAYVDAGTADIDVSLQVTKYAISSGLNFRYVDASNSWLVDANATASGYDVYKRIAGTYNRMASGTTTGADGDLLRVIAYGPMIRVYINGALVYSGSDAQFQTATKHGMHVLGTTVARLGKFKAQSVEP